MKTQRRFPRFAWMTWGRARSGFFLLLAFAILTKLRFVVAYPFQRNADDANNFLAGIEMGRGNWNLHGWVMARDNLYFTDVLGDAILSRLFGPHAELMLWHGAIVWALIVIAAMLLAAKGLGRRAAVVAAAAVIALLAIAVPMNDYAFSLQSSPASHGAQVLLALLAFAQAAAIATSSRVRLWPAVGLTLLVFAVSFSDPLFVVMACLPILAACFVQPLANLRGRIAVAVCIVAGFVAGRLGLWAIHACGGFEPIPMTIRLASFDEVVDHARFAVRGLMMLVGADFTGTALDGNPSNRAYIAMLRFPFLFFWASALIAGIAGLLRGLRSWPDDGNGSSSSAFIDLQLLFGILLSALAAIVTNAIVDLSNIRYFIPAAVFGSILLARQYASMPLFALYTGVALAGSLLSQAHGIAHGLPGPIVADKDSIALRDKLQLLGLRHGYAGYWQSSVVTVASGLETTVLALQPDGVGPFRWFANMDWYRNAASTWRGDVFFIGTDDPKWPLAIPQNAIIERYGEPERIVPVGSFFIDVYDNGDGSLKLPNP
ncbi:MAG: hypothetical protein QM741_08875 [Rudaea sp.]|uniref:hypothetical protein n=1 Tax=Rudaea sp. TaxID=2136325 RepID=UPI0039E5248E